MDSLNASWPSPKGEVADPKCGPQNVVPKTQSMKLVNQEIGVVKSWQRRGAVRN